MGVCSAYAQEKGWTFWQQKFFQTKVNDTNDHETAHFWRTQELHIKEEVLRVHPGDSVEFTITHRNLEQAEMLVYPVDLMTLYLREKDLSRVTQVNLAGV